MNRKLEARALFYAVLVSIMVALISAAMLLSSYHQHMLMGHYQTKERLMYNCQSGVELILGSKEDRIQKTILDLYQEEKDSVILEQKAWGLLDVAFVKSWSGQGFYQDSICRSFLVGKEPENYTLKLAEGTEPLKVCGNSQIVGDVYLPKEGVERGFVHGKPYQGEKLIYGKVNVVDRFIDNLFLKDRFNSLSKLSELGSNYFLEVDSLEQSFGEQTAVLAEAKFNTAGLFLKGNILILATERIDVAAASQLEDVVLIAPEIVIEAGFQGTIQAFAWDSIVVESGAILEYPSVLGLLPYEERIEFSPKIVLKTMSLVNGTVVVPRFQYNAYKSKVQIEPEAMVMGQVWVNGLLQHNGTIHGSVFCEEFLLQTAAALYENYLLDAIIDRTKLSKFYLAPPLLSQQHKKMILKEIE